jgi:hypothetical protein
MDIERLALSFSFSSRTQAKLHGHLRKPNNSAMFLRPLADLKRVRCDVRFRKADVARFAMAARPALAFVVGFAESGGAQNYPEYCHY